MSTLNVEAIFPGTVLVYAYFLGKLINVVSQAPKCFSLDGNHGHLFFSRCKSYSNNYFWRVLKKKAGNIFQFVECYQSVKYWDKQKAFTSTNNWPLIPKKVSHRHNDGIMVSKIELWHPRFGTPVLSSDSWKFITNYFYIWKKN